MTGVSPGRAAYESGGLGPNDAPWESLTDRDRQVWDDAADAACNADPRWPRCPDGCGCRIGTDDADSRDCGCDGPCTAECRENGYPDALSYRDAAVKHAMDERDEARFVVAEMCNHWERIGTTREEDELIPVWRERAGLVTP